MEAVFAKDRGLFSTPSTPKTYYHPTSTTPKTAAAAKLQAEGSGVINISLHKAGQGPAAHTLQPFTKGPLHFPPSSSPQSDPVWSLKCSLPDHWGKDLSSGESSNFDESWPSKSEESPGGGCGPSSVEAGPDHGEEGPVIVEQEDQLSKSESHESMLARYVERFRQAPPTDRASRNAPGNFFWWKPSSNIAGNMALGDTTSSSASSSSSSRHTHSDHTHTNPSPGVSEDLSLDSRSQDLIDRGSGLLASIPENSPPASKYLNTLSAKEPSRPHPPVRDQQRDVPLTPADDILIQWRLRRKIEQARAESAILNKSSGRGFLLDTWHGRGHGDIVHPLSARMATHSQCVCCAGHHCCHLAAPAGGVANSVCQCGCHVRGGSGQGEGLRKSQQVQTSPIPSTNFPEGVSGLSAKVGVATPGNQDTEAACRQTAESADHKATPTHGGLALRELTLSEEEETFTMTFNTELETVMSSTRMQGQPLPPNAKMASTPVKGTVQQDTLRQDTSGQNTSGQDISGQDTSGQGSPLQLLSQSPAGSTSKGTVIPLQTTDSLEASPAGFPWDYDMGDELLKLLITKARLFEAQIREIDGWLMDLQEQEQ